MYIGKIHNDIDVSSEYDKLAKKDEEVARLLMKNAQYRHSIYFFIQSMEKLIRSKIFTLVNPNIEYFRKKNQNHSLNNAIEFLIEIISSDVTIQEQVKKYINFHVFEDINFQRLHNNLRYPFFSERYGTYSRLEFGENDCKIVEKKLGELKRYINELNRLGYVKENSC